MCTDEDVNNDVYYDGQSITALGSALWLINHLSQKLFCVQYSQMWYVTRVVKVYASEQSHYTKYLSLVSTKCFHLSWMHSILNHSHQTTYHSCLNSFSLYVQPFAEVPLLTLPFLLSSFCHVHPCHP